jgi:4-cresol dehydrogenase (hydroxylating) flavoprotein subunit
MGDLAFAIKAWQELLGDDNVIVTTEVLSAAQTATFATTQSIPAIIRPANREQVQACVRIANIYKTPIYPISGGRNWGYGSRVPVADGCTIIDLRRMAEILDFDENLAYITIEPGVSFGQLAKFLKAQGSKLFASVVGSGPETSVIGNTIERGVGLGYYGDRINYVSGFEVVLPTGDCIHTGFGRFANARAGELDRWGIGPALDGLFTQSNLGIITKMTVWLMTTPEYYQSFAFSINNENFAAAITSLQLLKRQGLMGNLGIWNDYKILSGKIRYPWKMTDEKTPLPPELFEKLKQSRNINAWNGKGTIYSASKKQGRAERKVIKQQLKDYVDQLIFFDGDTVKSYGKPLDNNLTNTINLNIAGEGGLGSPYILNIYTAYWRKKMALPKDPDPDRDGCGIIWCSPMVPFAGKDIRIATTIIEEISQRHQFEPSIALLSLSERTLKVVAAIVYDRNVTGEDERALACYQEMFAQLINEGYFPYRLGIQSMHSLPPAQDDYNKVLMQIKRALDPNDILAPGRYDFRPVTGAAAHELATQREYQASEVAGSGRQPITKE